MKTVTSFAKGRLRPLVGFRGGAPKVAVIRDDLLWVNYLPDEK